MKKKLFIAAMMLLCLSAAAMAQNQPGQQKKTPEEMMQNRADNVASKLLLSDAGAAKFTPVYVEFLKAEMAILEKYRPEKPANGEKVKKTDSEIEAALRLQFDKSQELLDLRKAYLDKYLKVLSARQVTELYEIEREQQHHKAARHDGAVPPKK